MTRAPAVFARRSTLPRTALVVYDSPTMPGFGGAALQELLKRLLRAAA